MRIYIDFSLKKIEKIEPSTMYFGNENVDMIELYFKNFTEGWFATISAEGPDKRQIYPRLADTDGEFTITQDDILYHVFEFTLSSSNGWNLTPGRNLFYIWIEKDNKAQCVGSFGASVVATSGYYLIDNPYVNPVLREYLENSFKQHINEVNTKFDELKEDFNDNYSKEVTHQRNLINNLIGGEPRYVNTSSNILSLTSNKGVAVATDNGHWYYWNGTQYADGGQYLSNPDEVNENRLAIQDIDNVLFYNKNDLTTQGKVINYQLNITDNDFYAISDVIHLYNNYKVKGNTYIEGGVCCLFECTSDGTPIRYLRISSSVQPSFDFEFTARKEMYVRLCLRDNGYARVFKDLNADISDINNSLGFQLDKDKYSFGLNLYNYKTRSAKGYWCNYTNGNIESNQYVTYYSYSEYIEVEPNTEYTRTTGDRGTCFFNKDKVFISGSTSNTFTTPSNCKYIIMNADYDTAYYWMLVKGNSLPSVYQPYFLDLKYKSPYSDLLMIGTGTQYPTIKEGFEYAVANNLGVIITPGTYDLVSEGISGVGYMCPRIVYGYGVTLVCNLSEENWTLSPININQAKAEVQKSTEIYGLTIICSNCRYCIHDEMGGNTNYYYHNVFKDLILINNGVISSTLIKPQCIGGGIGGAGGYIEIVNCITESNCFDDISYHSQFDGNQTGNCTIIIKDCDIKNTVVVAEIGSSTSFMNVLRITNCLCGTLPTNVTYTNIKLISWNNVLRA